MRKVLLFLVGLGLASSLSAQAVVKVHNTTSCNLVVQLTEVDPMCVNTAVVNYYVPAGGTILVNASPGHEYIHAEIYPWPLCSGSISMSLGTAGLPCATCSWGIPSSNSFSTSGCSGCPPVIHGMWICDGSSGLIGLWG